MGRRWTLDDLPGQQGRTVLVTGANDGLGYHVASAFAGKGAAVLMACRDLAKADRARAELLAVYPGARLSVVPLDLGDLGSVERCADVVVRDHDRLHVVMCNAGIMAVPFGLTKDGFELQMGVNYYGHFALVGRLMPLIRRAAGARVVTTSSVGEKFGTLAHLEEPPSPDRYSRWRAYSDSKLAMLLFGLTLDEYFRTRHVDAKGVSAHPGFARTGLRTTRLETEKDPWQRFQLKLYEAISMPGEQGALALLYAAAAPEIAGGEYVGVSGFGEVRGWPRVTRGQRRAYDPQLRRRLWDHSERVTGVTY